MIKACLPVLACLVSGCGSGPTDRSITIDQHLAAGRLGEAERACREQVRAMPEDPNARIRCARVYLELKQGKQAEIYINQALEHGADREETSIFLARALLLQRRYLDVVEQSSDGLNDEVSSALELLKLEAELNLPDSERPQLRRRVSRFVRQLEESRAPWAAARVREMESLSSIMLPVKAALEHARCRPSPRMIYQPKPIKSAKIFRVGPNRQFKTPGEAAAQIPDGAVLEIDQGEYVGGVAHWLQSNLTIRGVGGRPHIRAAGKAVEGRDIWLFSGDDITVENIEFSGARADRSKNGAGIRHMGDNLTIRGSYFHDNENGVLTWKSPSGTITIEFSEFARNGYGDGLTHNAYIGETARLVFRYNYSHAARNGHLLKSRARENEIRYNRLTTEQGATSYVIDLPNGGSANVVGNLIEKGVKSQNPYVLTFGQEGLAHDQNGLVFAFNTLYNRYEKTTVLRNASKQPAQVINNLIGGAPTGMATGPYEQSGNLAFSDHGMVDPRQYDFSLGPFAKAVDQSEEVAGAGTLPEYQYEHPVSGRLRVPVGPLDVGALEYCESAN